MPHRAIKPNLLRCAARSGAYWAQGTYRVSYALGADRACTGALRRCRQTCALVSGSEVLVAAGARVAHARVFIFSRI